MKRMHLFFLMILFLILYCTGTASANNIPGLPMAHFYYLSIPAALLAIIALNHRINPFNFILFIAISWNSVVGRQGIFLYFVVIIYLGWFLLAWRASKYGEKTPFNLLFIWVLFYPFIWSHFVEPPGFMFITIFAVAAWLYYEFHVNEQGKIVFPQEENSLQLKQPRKTGKNSVYDCKPESQVKDNRLNAGNEYLFPSKKEYVKETFLKAGFNFSLCRKVAAIVLGSVFVIVCFLSISSEKYSHLYVQHYQIMRTMDYLARQIESMAEEKPGKKVPTADEFQETQRELDRLNPYMEIAKIRYTPSPDGKNFTLHYTGDKFRKSRWFMLPAGYPQYDSLKGVIPGEREPFF